MLRIPGSIKVKTLFYVFALLSSSAISEITIIPGLMTGEKPFRARWVEKRDERTTARHNPKPYWTMTLYCKKSRK